MGRCKDEKMLSLLFVSLLAGSWMSLKVVQCSVSARGVYNVSLCYVTRSGKTCFTTFFTDDHRPVRRSFDNASDWCKAKVPGSSLIVIKSTEDQQNVDRFIDEQGLQNETFFTEARKLSASESRVWSWINGYQIIPKEVRERGESFPEATFVAFNFGQESLVYLLFNDSSQFAYICEHLDSKLASSYRQNNKYYVAREALVTWFDARKECLRTGGDLASITDHRTIANWSRLSENQKYWTGLHRNTWIWKSTGAAITYTNWADGYPDESSDKQCISINPRCRIDSNLCEVDHKWWSCDCNNNYAIVCQKENVLNDEMLSSTSADVTSFAYLPVNSSAEFRHSPSSSSSSSSATASSTSATRTSTTDITTITPTKSTIANATTSATATMTTTTVKQVIPNVTTYISTTTFHTARDVSRKTESTSSMTHKSSNNFSQNVTTASASSSTGFLKSFNTKDIIFILLLLVAFAFIVFTVIFIIRKRKCDRRNEGSSLKNTKQSETAHSAYATVVPGNKSSESTDPPGNTIYADVEMIQGPTPSSNAIYATVQPTTEAVDMGKSAVYVDLDFPQKVQQKTKSADTTIACVSPISSKPYVPSASASNTVYAEPLKPAKSPASNAPVLNRHAAADQAGQAIPLDNQQVTYSEPNKPTKSSPPTDKAVDATSPIYLEAIEVKHEATSGCPAEQDPRAIYTEPKN